MAEQDQTYTASQAAHLSGFNINTLKDLRNHSPLRFEGSRDGWTRYTFNDILTLRAFALLRANGFGVAQAARIANFAAKRYCHAVAPQSVEMPGKIIVVEFIDDGIIVLRDIPFEANAWDYLDDIQDDFTTKRISSLCLNALGNEVAHRIRQAQGRT